MTARRRDSRPYRSLGLLGVRSGVAALLALGSGVGCGRAMIREDRGQSQTAASLGRDEEALPGRKLAWSAGGGVLGRDVKPDPLEPDATTVQSVLSAARAGASIETNRPTRAPKVEPFDGSTFARTSWNGWKLPDPASAESVAKAASPTPSPTAAPPVEAAASPEPKIAMPRPVPGISAGPGLPAPLLDACRDTKIAPPLRRAGESEAGLDGLVAACRDTKLAPPRRPSSAPAVPALAPQPPAASESSAAEIASAAPADVSRMVIGPVEEPPATAPMPAAPAETTAAVAAPLPVAAPEGPESLPALGADGPVAEAMSGNPADSRPDVAAGSEPSAAPAVETVAVPPLSPTPAAVESPADALQAASLATKIELPRPTNVAVETAAAVAPSAAAHVGSPIPVYRGTLAAGGPPASGPASLIPPPASAVAMPAPSAPANSLDAACQATNIPPPARIVTPADPLLEACRSAKIPPPVSPPASR